MRFEFLPFIRPLQALNQAAIVDLPASLEKIERASLILGLPRLTDCEKPLGSDVFCAARVRE